MFDLESHIRVWKTHVYTARSIGPEDVVELESHLRDSVDGLMQQGLSAEESFLIAVRRLGDIDLIQAEFAKVSTEELWQQLFIPQVDNTSTRKNRTEIIIVFALAVFAGLLSKVPALFGYGDFDSHGLIYAQNASFFALFPVALYLGWKRTLPRRKILFIGSLFFVVALMVNGYPSRAPHHTATLTAIHVPIITIFLLMYFYAGPSHSSDTGWRSVNTRLNYIRFIGESFVFAVLIGLGGIVLIMLTLGTFDLLGIDVSPFVLSWMGPLGFFGLFPVAAYLVEQKKSLIESIAPVLSRIFTPLFLVVTVSLIIAFAITPHAAYENRAMLIWFDLILALVLALTLYSISAKDYHNTGERTIWDIFSLTLLIAAICVDSIALGGIIIRLTEYGLTPNKLAVLGENIILLLNLILLAIGYLKYVLRKSTFQKIVTMQMRFLPIYPLWAAVVVVIFPLLFVFV